MRAKELSKRRARVCMRVRACICMNKITSRQTRYFSAAAPSNLHPAHQGKTEQMNMPHDHHPCPSQRGRGGDGCAPSTRQTLKIDKFLQEFLTRPLTRPRVNNGNYSTRHPPLKQRACLSCDIILVPEMCVVKTQQ